MNNIVLVTDSTAYIPQDLVQKHNIRVIPQVLIWGDETLRDGVDIQPDEFYRKLQKASVMPSTSQASPVVFYNVFQEILDAGDQALAVVVSSRLSGTLSSAVQAKDQLPGAPIEVFDSNTTSMAMGFMVLEAARAAQSGANMGECLRLLETMRDKTGIFIAVETLEFLHRGGRIGGAARLFGTALNIKPILELRDGRIEPLEKIRTRTKAHNRLVELVEAKICDQCPIHLAILHADCEDDAQVVLQRFASKFELKEQFVSPVSPVVGTHVGPGTIGVAYLVGI